MSDLRAVPRWQFWSKRIFDILNYIVGGAVGGAIVVLIQNAIDLNHKNAIEHLNQQIEKLYQPLVEKIHTNDVAWCAFVIHRWRATKDPLARCDDPALGYWDAEVLPYEDVIRWRDTIEAVFMESNRSIQRTIDENRGLLIDPHRVPPVWDRFQQHVTGYQAMLQEWHREGDDRNKVSRGIGANIAKPAWPDGFGKCVRTQLDALVAERDRLQWRFWAWQTSGLEKKMPPECL